MSDEHEATGGDIHWLREAYALGRTWFRVGREGDSLIAEWEELGAVRATLVGDEWDIRVMPRVGLAPPLDEKWRRGLVRAMVRHLEGRPTLHASAVRLEGAAFAFLGDSGAGKSTCAADLCSRLGAELLADDTVELEVSRAGYSVGATETSHWLLSDAATELGFASIPGRKAPRAAARVAHESARLAAIVVLQFDDDASPATLTPLRGHPAFEGLTASFVRFLLDDSRVALRDLDTLSHLARAVPILLLRRPRRLAALAQSASLIRELGQRLTSADGAPAAAS